jgi:hypothetical protein
MPVYSVANDGRVFVVLGADLSYRLRNRVMNKVASMVDLAKEDAAVSCDAVAIVAVPCAI